MRARTRRTLGQLGVLLLLLSAVLALAGCGGKHQPRPVAPSAKAACPKASDGQHGALGVCAPQAIQNQLSRSVPRPLLVPLGPKSGGQQVADLSNNDPCYCGGSLRAQGYSGLIVKANQGEGFRDRTMAGMVSSARSAGLTVGAYDFDQDYTVGEAVVFVQQLHAAGIYGNSRNTFPAYLDVEYGNFSYGGLAAQVGYLRSQGYRVGIYTGEWYWSPHAGCQFPGGLSSVWLSGYPNASVPCGTYAYNLHQFTDSPFDRSVFLGSDFGSFVSSGPTPPPPDPYGILSKTKYPFGRFKFDAYDAVKQYDHPPTGGPGCSHQLRRRVCVILGWEVHLLHGRRLFVAYHVLTSHGWVRRHHAHWTRQTGPENALLARREVNRNPTYLK